MRIGIFGTGSVGNGLGTKLVALGHEVKMGSRSAKHEKAVAWAEAVGTQGAVGTYADAADFGDLLFNCTAGGGALEALALAGAERMKRKVLIDVSNPLDFSKGFPPTLFTGNTDSLGEQIQRAFPETLVVKTLNTVSVSVMVDPAKLGAETDLFLSGNDAGAKGRVKELLQTFGWKSFVDLGDISTARGTESYLALWVRLYGAFKTPDLNIKIVKAG